MSMDGSAEMLRIAGIVSDSIVDGPGIRLTLFTQGCKHGCPGCHNPQTHAFDGGRLISIDAIIEMVRSNPLLDGVTISGGEPFEQAGLCSELARRVHEEGLNVIVYSGYTFEEIIQGSDSQGWDKLLKETDILVDGRFILEKRNFLLKFRGSENQRCIDVKSSLLQGRPVIANI